MVVFFGHTMNGQLSEKRSPHRDEFLEEEAVPPKAMQKMLHDGD